MKKELFAAYLALAGICIIWGTTFLVMRIGVMDFPPFLFAGIRQFVAGVLLSGFLIFIKKIELPSYPNLARQALAGLLMITLGNGLVTWAEVYVPSGVAAIICSFMPVWMVLVNLTINRSELPNGLIVTGVLTGLGGIVLVFSEHLADFVNTQYQFGIFLIFLSSLGWALGSVMIKREGQKTNPFLNAGLQMFFGGLWCFVLSLLFDDLSDVHFASTTIFSIGYLSIVGSITAFMLYTYALTKLPITIASLYAYINPLVAVVLGWVVLDEKLNFKIGIAIVVTVIGIYLVNRGYQLKTQKALDASKL